MRRPNTNSSPTPDAFCRRAAYLMAMRLAKAAMKNTQAQPWVRSRPTYAPRAKRPAVTATRPMVWLKTVRAAALEPRPVTVGGSVVVALLVPLSLALSASDEPAARGRGLLKAGDLGHVRVPPPAGAPRDNRHP